MDVMFKVLNKKVENLVLTVAKTIKNRLPSFVNSLLKFGRKIELIGFVVFVVSQFFPEKLFRVFKAIIT